MPFFRRIVFGSATALVALSLAACSATNAAPPDAGTDAAEANGPFVAPVDPGKGGFLVTVSGEALAVTGYDWTSSSLAQGDPPGFVDGWEVRFEHVILTLGNIRLNADPDKDPGAPDKLGPLVAEAKGPFALDLTLGGNITGKSGDANERTVAVAAFTKEAGNFDPSARYAFSYETLAASKNAKVVNLDSAGRTLYDEATTKGYAMILQGTATYKGPAPEATGAFAKLPSVVKFTLGLSNPSSYLNCRNTDLQKVGSEFPRGVQPDLNKSVTTQITIHTDHLFWSKLNVEGTPLHFDPIAANASSIGFDGGTTTASIDDLLNVDITGVKTKSGEALPWRSVVSDFTPPSGQLKYDPNGTSFSSVNSYAHFLAYSAASGGHLNADGECNVKHNFVP